jgi:hypothetical protein
MTIETIAPTVSKTYNRKGTMWNDKLQRVINQNNRKGTT